MLAVGWRKSEAKADMPEGDTIHKLAAYLRPRLEGRRIAAGVARAPEPTPLTGRRILSVEALGKHLLLRFEDGALLRSHLGMWGSWHRYRLDEPWRRPAREAAVELTVTGQVYVCFTPKEVEWLRDQGLRHRSIAARLGPDLIRGDHDYAVIVRRMREILAPHKPLADALLDQRIAAGIGNVYKSELLYLERLHPLMQIGRVDDATLSALYRCARALLRDNLGGGPRVTRAHADGGSRLWVYGRRDCPCFECSTPITCARLGAEQRSTYWCPRCQAL